MVKDHIDPDAITFSEEPVRHVMVRAFCDCGQHGELKSMGQVITTGCLSSWDHKCAKCGAQVMLDKTYPRIEHRVVE